MCMRYATIFGIKNSILSTNVNERKRKKVVFKTTFSSCDG